MLAYVKYMILLLELQKMLSQELKCLCSKSITVLLEWTVPKTMDVVLYRPVYPLVVVIHCIGWGCQFPNPLEIHFFKWKFCVQFAWYRFAQHFSGIYPWNKTRLACVVNNKCMCVYIYIYTHTHTHTHTRLCGYCIWITVTPNTTVCETFLHKSGVVWSGGWIFITGALAWRWMGEYVTVDKNLKNLFIQYVVM